MRYWFRSLGAASGAALALIASAPGATASELHLHYVAYAAGLHVLDLAVDLDMEPGTYRVALQLHTVGFFSALVSGRTTTEVEGTWSGIDAAPTRYRVEGLWRGNTLQTMIDYRPGGPYVHDLLPDPDPEPREPVPATLQLGTIDSLSAMAALLRRVALTGSCAAQQRLFDGRSLSEVASRTVGIETLPTTSRSSFQGPALRCDFEGHLLAGFRRDESLQRATQQHGGSAWFASLAAGGPLLPVRITFETRFFGHATMYLAPDLPPPG